MSSIASIRARLGLSVSQGPRERAGLDPRGRELALLRACNTDVGAQLAGQRVASSQSALHSAGARSATTSLWKVSEEAAREERCTPRRAARDWAARVRSRATD